jgi:hypothetical protein
MREVAISCGLFEDSRNRFTLALGEPITIVATGERWSQTTTAFAARARRADGWHGQFEQFREKVAGLGGASAWNEGVGEHVRTRFHE